MVRREDDFYGKTDELSLAVDLREVERASAWLEELADRDNWPERARFALQISLEEVLANVISHGFGEGDAADAVISVDYCYAPDVIQLNITDNGLPFDPTSLEEIPLPDSVETAAIGGHGIRLVRRMLDQFSYHYTDGRNHLLLGFGLGAKDQPPPV